KITAYIIDIFTVLIITLYLIKFHTYFVNILTVRSHIYSASSLTFAFNLKAAIVSPSDAQQFTAVSPAAFTSPILAPRANSRTLTAY
ncbi:hypothetical protein ALC57_02997, partial [Trachymyrmex cornetzi]